MAFMGKKELVLRVANRLESSKVTAGYAIEAVFDGIADFLSTNVGESDRDVQLKGFGTFSVRQMPARKGRNPKTGEEITIPPTRKLTFRPSNELKKRIKGQKD